MTDFVSILVITLLLLIFWLLIFFSTKTGAFSIESDTALVMDSISLNNMLRTPIEFEGRNMNYAEMVSLFKDNTRKEPIRNIIVSFLDSYFGKDYCAMLCIDKEKIQGAGCLRISAYGCQEVMTYIPTYDGNPIGISLLSEATSISSPNS